MTLNELQSKDQLQKIFVNFKTSNNKTIAHDAGFELQMQNADAVLDAFANFVQVRSSIFSHTLQDAFDAAAPLPEATEAKKETTPPQPPTTTTTVKGPPKKTTTTTTKKPKKH